MVITDVKRTNHRPYSRSKRTRVYFWPEDYNPIEEMKSGFRWNKPYDVYRRYLPEVFKQLDLPRYAKTHWSQKAGCACGCSAGFIVEGSYGFDISVKYTN